MIAMQYSFTLPADYDMAILERRIAEKGSALDQHEPLLLKTYNVARRGEMATLSNENLYAHFYVWKDAAGISDFLCSAGFKGLVQSFGWPTVRVWPVVLACELIEIQKARYATRELVMLPPFTSLGELRKVEAVSASDALKDGAVGAVTAFEPTAWSMVRLRAWKAPRSEDRSPTTQAYAVQHVCNPPDRRWPRLKLPQVMS